MPAQIARDNKTDDEIVHVNKPLDFLFETNECRQETLLLINPMDQRALKNVNNILNTNIYSYFETSGGQSSNLYLNVVHFFNTSVN